MSENNHFTPPALPREIAEEYDIEVTARRACSNCADIRSLHVSMPGHTLEDFNRYVKAEIDERMEKDGWRVGYCPECAFEHREHLHAEAHADDYRDEVQPEGVAVS